MNVRVYPILLDEPDEKGLIAVYVPDFDAYTQGLNLANAMYMARDLIYELSVCYKKDGKVLPEPSSVSSIKPELPWTTVTLVDVDFDKFQRRAEQRSVKKTLTLPGWLNEIAEESGVNFSAILQEGLKRELGLISK